MNIDVVIGNQPYNNDIYIPFVETGHNLASTCSVFITPAKWQAKGGKQNEQFRADIVPYMKDIIYFIETKEVFDIGEPDGISVYSIDKYEHINKRIRLRCNANNVFDTEPEEIDCSKGVRILSSKIASIVDKCSIDGTIENKLSFTSQVYCNWSEKGHPIKSDEHNIGLYQGADNIYGCAKLSGWLSKDKLKTTRNLERYKCIQSIRYVRGSGRAFGADGKTIGGNLITILEPYQVPKGTFQELMTFETKLGAESFKSFIMSKLCSFLEFIGVCGHAENTESYRFVPDPGAFDHIFTDEELYKKYNLTEEEINIIESVIKERK
jgi:site-specific DNA-methyltransferase (adenine-specific)